MKWAVLGGTSTLKMILGRSRTREAGWSVLQQAAHLHLCKQLLWTRTADCCMLQHIINYYDFSYLVIDCAYDSSVGLQSRIGYYPALLQGQKGCAGLTHARQHCAHEPYTANLWTMHKLQLRLCEL